MHSMHYAIGKVQASGAATLQTAQTHAPKILLKDVARHCLRSLKIKVQEIARTSHLDTSVRVTSVTVRTRFHCTKWLNTAK